MTTTPSIDLDLAGISAAQPAPPASTPPPPDGNPPPAAVGFSQSALERPFADATVLRPALEDVVCQISRIPLATTAVPSQPAIAPSQPAAVPQPPPTEAPLVDAAPVRVADAQPPVFLFAPEGTRLDGASTTAAPQPQPQTVVPQPAAEVPQISAVPSRTAVVAPADETELADAVVAAGVRVADPVVPPVVPPAVDVSVSVTAVDAVKAAFAPAAVPATETFLAAANAVADVLLVTPGLLRGEGEIRVQLRPDVLEGSEVRIAVAGRRLDIAFVPQTVDVAALIEQNRPQLEQHLAARFQTFRLSVGVLRRRADDGKGSWT